MSGPERRGHAGGADRRGDGGARPPPVPGPNVDVAGLAGALAATREGVPRMSERLRHPTVWVVVAVVAVVLVVLLAIAAGVFHLPGSGSSSTPVKSAGASSFYGTLGAALSTARASYWSWPASGQPALVFAEGLASPTALGPVVNVSHLGPVRCAPTLIADNFGSPPVFRGPLTQGLASVWLYAFLATGSTLVVVAVVNGTSAVVATTPTNGACYNGPGSFSTVPVDSSVAAEAAGATNASMRFFAAASANSTAVSGEFFLAPPGYLTPTPMGEPMWILTDTTCQLYGGSASAGTILTSLVNAGTGTLYSQSSTAVIC